MRTGETRDAKFVPTHRGHHGTVRASKDDGSSAGSGPHGLWNTGCIRGPRIAKQQTRARVIVLDRGGSQGPSAERADHVARAAVGTDRPDPVAHALQNGEAVVREGSACSPAMSAVTRKATVVVAPTRNASVSEIRRSSLFGVRSGVSLRADVCADTVPTPIDTSAASRAVRHVIFKEENRER